MGAEILRGVLLADNYPLRKSRKLGFNLLPPIHDFKCLQSVNTDVSVSGH